MKKNTACRHSLFLRLATICLIFISSQAFGASIQWTSGNGKETLHILLSPNDGFAGRPQRIDTNGVLIPFSEVPPNLLIQNPPEGAKLVDSTMQLGTALAIKTQTPKFGFVVSKQTPKELIIDFFPDPLGARWRRPQQGNSPEATTQVTTVTLPEQPATDTANNTADVASAPKPSTKPGTEQTPAAEQTPGAKQIQPAAAEALPGTDPAQTQPPAAAEVSATVTVPAMSEATTQAPAAAQAPLSSPGSMPEQTATPTSPQTAQSYTAIPATVAGTATSSTPATAPFVPQKPADTQPNSANLPANANQPVLVGQTPDQINDVPQNQASTSGVKPSGQLSTASAPPDATSQTALPAPLVPNTETSPRSNNPFYGMEDEDLPVGHAVNAGPSIMYRGRINLGGEDQIDSFPATQPETNIPAYTPQPQSATVEQGTQPSEATAPALEQTSSNTQGAAQPALSTPNESTTAPQSEVAENLTPTQEATSGAANIPTSPGNMDGSPTEPGNQQANQTQPTATPSANNATAPEDDASPPASPTANTPPSPDTPGAPAPENVIYVDEQGNPVEPPLVPAEALAEALLMLSRMQFEDGLALMEKLLTQSDLTFEQREEALHLRSEFLFNIHRDNLAENFQIINDATLQAYNFNQSSPRNADALLRLGYMNLQVDNLPEAEAWFNILRKLFPENANIPLTYYYWGEYYYDKGELAKAADQFQYVLQKYPDSRFAKDASLGLGRAYYQMGYYKEAFDIVDYMNRRWPGYYLDYPPFLNMIGDSAFRLGKMDSALDNYWLYANLEPSGAETDMVLSRIGDIYSDIRQPSAAAVVYKLAAERFPDKDGGLIAKMRLAEASVQDAPTILDMFSVFDASFDANPKAIYSKIIQEHPDSPIAPLAMLKLAMWHLWQKEYTAALDTTTEFMAKFPDHALAPKAKEVALEAYAILSAVSAQEGHYDQMRKVWEKYPIVHEQMDSMTPESRMSLAYSYWKANQPDAALEAISNFFIGPKVPVYSEAALNLALSIYLEHDQWLGIREVANRVGLWELTPSAKQNLDYALALAAENLGETDVAAPLWERLYLSDTLTDAQKAYAAYFLSREAERKNELERAYLIGLDALTRLSNQVQKDPEQLDLEKLKTQVALLMRVAERAGRLNEALQYAHRYLEYLDANDPERAAVKYRMARIYKTQGDDESWRQGLEDIINLYPNSVYGQTAASELKSADLQKGIGGYSPTGSI